MALPWEILSLATIPQGKNTASGRPSLLSDSERMQKVAQTRRGDPQLLASHSLLFSLG